MLEVVTDLFPFLPLVSFSKPLFPFRGVLSLPCEQWGLSCMSTVKPPKPFSEYVTSENNYFFCPSIFKLKGKTPGL